MLPSCGELHESLLKLTERRTKRSLFAGVLLISTMRARRKPEWRQAMTEIHRQKCFLPISFKCN